MARPPRQAALRALQHLEEHHLPIEEDEDEDEDARPTGSGRQSRGSSDGKAAHRLRRARSNALSDSEDEDDDAADDTASRRASRQAASRSSTRRGHYEDDTQLEEEDDHDDLDDDDGADFALPSRRQMPRVAGRLNGTTASLASQRRSLSSSVYAQEVCKCAERAELVTLLL